MKKPIKNTLEPLVSIITPVYNTEDYIAQNIESILAQTYQNWEQIIIDDNSTDGSLDIIKRYTDKRIRCVSLSKNGGAAQARNRATIEAKGEYISFLDADDLWHPDKLSKQIVFMQANNCAVSYTSYLHIDEKGNALGKRIKAIPQLTYSKQHKNNYIGNLTGVYKVTDIGKIIAPNIRKRQDWAVWLEAIKKSREPALGLQEDLAYYRVHSNSMSSNKFKLIKYNYRFYRKYLGYSVLKSSICLLQFFIDYFVNRKKWIERF